MIAGKAMNKPVVVSSYNPEWPKMFEAEAAKIQKSLGDHCLAVHHIGSTSVPGLAAKPKIDIIVVVSDPIKAIEALEKIGFQYKGEYNIPLHYGFSKRGRMDVNLHVYEAGHPEIELNLLFRDYLREHPEARDEYARLKFKLVEDRASSEIKNSMFNGYNLGKDAFIHKILRVTNFNRLRIMRCIHHAEWKMAKSLRQKYFFDPQGILDPYTWTFGHDEHIHLILYLGVEIIGYAHIQLWTDHRAALRIFVVDEPYRRHGFGSQFLQLCEQWLRKQGVHSLHDEARPEAVKFYRKNGFSEMSFNDPSGEPPSPQDIAMGKNL